MEKMNNTLLRKYVMFEVHTSRLVIKVKNTIIYFSIVIKQ